MDPKIVTTRLVNQIKRPQIMAFFFVFQARYLKSNAMAKNTFAIMASIEAGLRIAKTRFRKAVNIASVWPLYQLASEMEMIQKGRLTDT